MGLEDMRGLPVRSKVIIYRACALAFVVVAAAVAFYFAPARFIQAFTFGG